MAFYRLFNDYNIIKNKTIKSICEYFELDSVNLDNVAIIKNAKWTIETMKYDYDKNGNCLVSNMLIVDDIAYGSFFKQNLFKKEKYTLIQILDMYFILLNSNYYTSEPIELK